MEIGHAVKSVVMGMPALVTGGVPGSRAGDERLAWFKPGLEARGDLPIRSNAFENGSGIPSKYSADEAEISPPISWASVPEGVRSFVLIVEDPDAPTPNPFVHWLLYNIPSEVRDLPDDVRHEELAAAARGAMQGKNSNLKIGWAGMAPPKGDTPHHYHFQLFALDRMLPLEPGAGRTALIEAMREHVIVRGELVGTYAR
jgi:Raf kinase inhibitor-like YbhB/YbcL family protein